MVCASGSPAFGPPEKPVREGRLKVAERRAVNGVNNDGDMRSTRSQSAENARRAGFDGLELHAQGSHLIPQFLNPRLNQRTDAYGGSSEKRAQFLLDVLDAVSDVWGSDRIGVKMSPGWASGSAFTADEETRADYDQLLKKLNDNNLAYLHLLGAPGTVEERVALFSRYRAHYQGGIIANLGFTQALGNEILEHRIVDAVSFGAPFIANPDLVERFAQGHPLAEGDRDAYYAGQAEGYTDYPAFTATDHTDRASHQTTEIPVSSNIRAMIANVEVESLEDAIPLYRELAGDVDVRRFPYRELEVALVGPFLLYAGPLEKYVSQTATVLVDSLDPVLDALGKAGAEILEAPNEVPNGTRIVARHPDGSVFEYMRPRS